MHTPLASLCRTVGAGGIGQELKNSTDLLDFARLFTIIPIILAMVTVIAARPTALSAAGSSE